MKNKDIELKELTGVKEVYSQRIELEVKRRELDLKRFKSTLAEEQHKTISAQTKLEQIKLEFKMLETNSTSAGAIWKKKCIDLFEISQQVKLENDELRTRCKDLIE